MSSPLVRAVLALLSMGLIGYALSHLDWSGEIERAVPASVTAASAPASSASEAASVRTAASKPQSDPAQASAAAPPASSALVTSAASATSSGITSAALPASAASAGRVAGAASSPPVASTAPAASSASGPQVARAPRSVSCADLARQLPNLTEALCQAAQMKESGYLSVEGFPLYQLDVIAPMEDELAPSVGPKPPRRPRVLVIGAIHGDEISSTSLVFHWIAHARETGADMDWRFIPALNPDGLLQKRPTRTNARGVDLNRNFPTPNWDKEALQYWTSRTRQDARRYPGPEALSEPETRFIQQTMASWKPDVVVSIHAPFGVLDYDGPSTPPERLGRLFLDRVGIYPGSLGNYGGVHRGVPVVTIELPSALRTPTDTEMRQMWIDLLRWIGERLTPTER